MKAFDNEKVDFDLVNKKLSSYNKVFNLEEFELKLTEKRKIYNQEMQRLTKVFEDFDTCKSNIIKHIQS